MMDKAKRYDIFLTDCSKVTARLTPDKLEVLLGGEPPMVDLCDVEGKCMSVNPAQVTCIRPNRGGDAE